MTHPDEHGIAKMRLLLSSLCFLNKFHFELVVVCKNSQSSKAQKLKRLFDK